MKICVCRNPGSECCTEIDLEKMYEFRDKCTVLKDIKDSYEVVKKWKDF